MNLPTILLAAGCAVLVISLLHALFGYKLARLLLPFCGLVLTAGALYIFVYPSLALDELGTWLFFAGSSLAVYIALFFFPCVAAFFTGFLGSALALLFVVYALGLHSLPLLYPACLTLCVISGLLAAAYRRIGVVVFSSLLGGCAAAFTGLFLFFEGADMTVLLTGNVLVPLEVFLMSRTLMIGGAALALALIGVVVQLKLTAQAQLFSAYSEPGARFWRRRPSNADLV